MVYSDKIVDNVGKIVCASGFKKNKPRLVTKTKRFDPTSNSGATSNPQLITVWNTAADTS